MVVFVVVVVVVVVEVVVEVVVAWLVPSPRLDRPSPRRFLVWGPVSADLVEQVLVARQIDRQA